MATSRTHRTTRLAWRTAALGAASVAAWRPAAGQELADTLPPRPAPGAVVGLVVDAGGRPVDSAEVRLGDRVTATQRDGTFRFDGVAPATYDVVARKLGYRPETRTLAVSAAGASVRIRLARVTTLAPVVTAVARGGLSGVVADTALRPVAGVLVDVLSDRARATTDSAGQFFVALEPGRYMVRVRRDGFRPQLVSVTVPREEGRRVAVTLVAASGPSAAREEVAVFDLQMRLNRRNAGRSHLLTREDILRMGVRELNDLTARAVGGAPITGGPCFVYLDGGPQKQALWTMETADVEFYEVYVDPPRRRTSNPARRGRDDDVFMLPPLCGNLTLVAWLRR